MPVSTSHAVAVFGASQITKGSAAWADAALCGRLLAGRGLTVVTGGYGGAMEAASEGAALVSGSVIGVTAPDVFPGRESANAFVATERPAPSLTERIHDMLAITDAAIALPGSIGTFTELMVAWNVSFVAQYNGSTRPPIVAVGPTWKMLVAAVGDELATDASLVTCVATVDEAVDHVVAGLPR